MSVEVPLHNALLDSNDDGYGPSLDREFPTATDKERSAALRRLVQNEGHKMNLTLRLVYDDAASILG